MNDIFFEKKKINQTEVINKHEVEVLGKVAAIFMKNGAVTLNNILGAEVEIPTPSVSIINYKELSDKLDKPYIKAQVEYTGDFNGRHILLLKKQDMDIFDNIQLASNNINQMLNSIKNSMVELLGININSSEPEIELIEFEDSLEANEYYISIRFPFNINNEQIGEVIELLPLDFGKAIINFLVHKKISHSTNQSQNSIGFDEGRKINIRPIELQSFENGSIAETTNDDGINLIIDVPLQLSVELGKSRKTIKEILELNVGSVVVLDKLAGELVDVIVNGKLIAKGEVVVIDESYGVRITEIINQLNKQRA